MDLKTAIQQYLPSHVQESAMNFVMPVEFVQQMPELITLVLESRSMDKDEEKQSRFNLLPMMNEDQVDKLKTILVKEKEKLKAIEDRYEAKKLEIKKKYLTRRQKAGYVKKIEDMRATEQAHREQELQEADSLLDDL